MPTPILDRVLSSLCYPRGHQLEEPGDNTPQRLSVEDPKCDFTGLRVYESLKLTAKAASRIKRHDSAWNLPLPFDLMFTIVHEFLQDGDNVAIRTLSRVSRHLSKLCLPILLRDITINTKQRTLPTSLEKLARFLSHNPHLVDFIHSFEIIDEGHMYQFWESITSEEESLCFILTRPFLNLQNLGISLPSAWHCMSMEVQQAFYMAFALPTLQKVKLRHLRLNVDFFSHLSHISSLNLSCDISLHDTRVDFGKLYCTPEDLTLKDISRGFVTNNLFHDDSSLRLSKLKRLVIHLRGRHAALLKIPLMLCSRTLTSLEVYIGYSASDPTTLDLSASPFLKSLTLTADVSGMSIRRPHENCPPFNWLVRTLSTCQLPSRIEAIVFFIRVYDYRAISNLPWGNLDMLFEPHPQERWPMLKDLTLRIVDDSIMDETRQGALEVLIVPMVPILAGMGLLKCEFTS